ncbi:MAG: phosphoribosylanthranilate isomerase [Candidatus Omnitrophica bacterium]|nr:phosphoribosylanthranilate isomerase [Candidatus Omnitrophota bacterium]
MTEIKICGITNEEDAKAAVDSGVDFLGFNFYPKSPRFIAPGKAKEIIDALSSDIARVGVFVNEEISVIEQTIRDCSLNLLQLHGDETVLFCEELKYKIKDYKLIKVFRIDNEQDMKFIPEFGKVADYYLLDTYSVDKFGGTGRTFSWNLACQIKKMGKPIFLSGGLTPENVEEAIKKVDPFCVDVASGVESYSGKKNLEKMKLFVEQVRSFHSG